MIAVRQIIASEKWSNLIMLFAPLETEKAAHAGLRGGKVGFHNVKEHSHNTRIAPNDKRE